MRKTYANTALRPRKTAESIAPGSPDESRPGIEGRGGSEPESGTSLLGMEIDEFISRIGFRLLHPDEPATRNYLRASYRLRRIGVPLDLLNTKFPEDRASLVCSLWRLVRVPGMSTFTLAGIINQAVRKMPSDQSYVNVGTWQGFSLFAGMLGNPEKRCVGIDNFSEFTDPETWGEVQKTFLQRFESWRSPAHEFFNGDYRDYFENHHHGPIGVYFYDGEHSLENQLAGLEVAERFFAEGCLILIDDAYAEEPRRATESFMTARPGRYEVVLDQPVARKGHPTFWNGFLILRRTGSSRASN